MAMDSPNVSECQALKEKVKSVIKKSSRENPEVAGGTLRLVESLLVHPLSAPYRLNCTITFGGLTFARRMRSAIR
uniref:Uncharacterized protein n=1 Tax=Solanum tuberosum TaxID=4113 RepID=M1DBD7_SOLTU